MNQKETAQLLSMIWSLYPNAPKITREDKEAMVFSWLCMLHEYSLADVWAGVKECMRKEPRFVPTAPEVMQKCEKSYNVERYLPKEYGELIAGIDQGVTAEANRAQIIRYYKKEGAKSTAEKAAYQRAVDERERIRKADAIWAEAYTTARIAYEQAERAKLADDGTAARLKQLAIL